MRVQVLPDHQNTVVESHFDESSGTLPPPPRFLWWLIIGGTFVFIVGMGAGVFVFRNVLRPGQQQRVINTIPFIKVFLPPRPAPDAVIPTALPSNNTISPNDLLNIAILTSTPVVSASPPAMLTETPQPTNTPPPTLEPTATQTLAVATRTTIPASLPTEVSLPPTAFLSGFRYVRQTWNNCGPATLTMSLSYYGWTEDQEAAQTFLRPDEEDKNVTPREMVTFVNEQTGVRAVTRMGGDLDLLKALLANGFPVIVSIGFMPEGYDWLGHYRALVGYDEYRRAFYAYDSYLGAGDAGEGISIAYSQLDRDWQQFNRTFVVLYPQADEGRVRELLGELAEPGGAAERALQMAQEEARAEPLNGYAWFNIGTSLIALRRYDEAALAYDQARRLNLPWRMLWYQFGPYEAYFNVGRYDDVLALVEANLNNGGQYVEETYYWQGQAYTEIGIIDDAVRAFNQALIQNPRYAAAQEALAALGTD